MKLLSGKPFYFLTDRDTEYTFLVQNNSKQLYYPDKFQQLTPNSISSAKSSFVRRFMMWGIKNKNKMAPQDFAIVFSRWFDGMGLILFGVMGCMITRRLLLKINTPFIESLLQGRLLQLNNIKSIAAIAIPTPLIYNRLRSTLNENYLYDLALQYQYNFDRSLKDSHVEEVLQTISKERFQKK